MKFSWPLYQLNSNKRINSQGRLFQGDPLEWYGIFHSPFRNVHHDHGAVFGRSFSFTSMVHFQHYYHHAVFYWMANWHCLYVKTQISLSGFTIGSERQNVRYRLYQLCLISLERIHSGGEMQDQASQKLLLKFKFIRGWKFYHKSKPKEWTL